MAKRLLYLEDDLIIREHICEFLQDEGYDVTLTANATEALKIWKKHKNFDILLADIHLPGAMNGLECIEKIRSMSPLLPRVIVTSAYSHDFYLLKALELRLSGYLTKPFNEEKLLKLLELATKEVEVLKNSTSLVNRHTHHLFKGCTWSSEEFLLIKDEKKIKLTRTENKILTILWRNRGTTVTSETLMTSLYEDHNVEDTEPLRSAVFRLRSKLGKARLVTLFGIGYMLISE